ncbi:transcriptional regulator [Halobacteriales archaeon QS_1_68_20]|nr:MAG: transcriptional regulator [Halobacteriales archaeon QS_1_68_20]
MTTSVDPADSPDPAESADPTVDDVLGALASETARRIVGALDRPKSARELAEELDLPETTVYRALERLSTASLLRERTAVRLDGHHTTEYAPAFEGVRITLREDRSLALAVERTGDATENSSS